VAAAPAAAAEEAAPAAAAKEEEKKEDEDEDDDDMVGLICVVTITQDAHIHCRASVSSTDVVVCLSISCPLYICTLNASSTTEASTRVPHANDVSFHFPALVSGVGPCRGSSQRWEAANSRNLGYAVV
jgi:hypothetical protein